MICTLHAAGYRDRAEPVTVLSYGGRDLQCFESGVAHIMGRGGAHLSRREGFISRSLAKLSLI